MGFKKGVRVLKSNCFFAQRILFSCIMAAFVLIYSNVQPAYAQGNRISQNIEQVQALALLNADRTKNGLVPLAYSAQLTKLAEDYAMDMINRQFFAHNNPEGLTPFDRMDQYDIVYRYAGENLALNDSVSAAQAAFMNSPTHRANVLNPNFTEVGIGVKYAPNGKIYVVQEFTGQ